MKVLLKAIIIPPNLFKRFRTLQNFSIDYSYTLTSVKKGKFFLVIIPRKQNSALKKKRYKNKKLLQEKSNFSEKVPTKTSNYKKTIKLFLKIADNPFNY